MHLKLKKIIHIVLSENQTPSHRLHGLQQSMFIAIRILVACRSSLCPRTLIMKRTEATPKAKQK